MAFSYRSRNPNRSFSTPSEESATRNSITPNVVTISTAETSAKTLRLVLRDKRSQQETS